MTHLDVALRALAVQRDVEQEARREAWQAVPAAWGPQLAERRRTPTGDDEGTAEDDPALRVLGPHGRLLDAVLRTVHTAGGGAAVDRDRLALFVAMGVVEAALPDLLPALVASRDPAGRFDPSRFFGGGFRLLHPLWPLAMLGNVAVGQVAIDLDVRGDNAVLGSEADAGIRALLEGAWSIAEGRSDAALVAATGAGGGPFAEARAWVEGLAPDTPLGRGAAACLLAPAGPGDAHLRLRGGATGFLGGEPAAAWQAVVRRTLGGREAATLHGVVAPADAALHAALDALDLGGLARSPLVTRDGDLGPAAPLAALARLPRPDGPPSAWYLVAAAGRQGGLGALLVEVPAS